MFKHFGSTAHCNPIDYDSLFVNISWINPKLTVDDFNDPWSHEIDTEWFSFSKTQTQIIIINHFYTTLETDSRRFGLGSVNEVEKKLVQNPVVRNDKSPYASHGLYPYLWLMFAPQAKRREISRSYISFLDAAGNVGG
jgi:hypothetical protein